MTTDGIVLCTQPGCGESRRVGAWLTERGITVTERDAGADPVAARALSATGLFAAPLLAVGDVQVLGFRPDALAQALRAEDGEG